MKQHFRVRTAPMPNPANVIRGENYRITVLTDRLIRLEFSENGRFCDEATQTVWFRDLGSVPFTVSREGSALRVETGKLILRYDGEEFSPDGLSIRLKGGEEWHFRDDCRDLGGTARTLDGVDGDRVKLDHGVVSRLGFSVLDDSRSLLLTDDGWFAPRAQACRDLYFFGYGHDYLAAVQDFYRICGPTPMLPRFTLGNWWSRYYKYTQESYLALMDRFAQEDIPLSVAVIDMDWHLVDIDPKYGSGWTGFTWNTAFFPDHRAFLAELHRRGMKTTLNIHPADGIRAFETAYPAIAAHMGAENGEAVPFDPTNPEFMQHYYADVLNPMEAEGVDFWWVDWQQGTRSAVPGLDPLWVLNHYDFLDSGRDGKRPLTFSRYAGPGSHRYPIGFSGDTIVTWESLRFQPRFTATASNIGYGWWSHDIGGHMRGYKNDELMARWTQLGAFSPILRLHSSNSDFNGKEPWRFNPETAQAMARILRLRHRMIPYLYTMNHRAWAEGTPLVLPLYYAEPENPACYRHDTQFFFGSGLLVQPVTSPRIPRLSAAKETVYLPEGIWFDFFTRQVYRGGREIAVYRPLETLPVFAKAGTILPLTDRIDARSAASNPEQLHVNVYLGQEGSFTLYEDDGETLGYRQGESAETDMTLTADSDTIRFTVHPVRGHAELLPAARSFAVELVGCRPEPGSIRVCADGADIPFRHSALSGGYGILVEADGVGTGSRLTVSIPRGSLHLHNDTVSAVFDFLNRAQIEFDLKDRIYDAVRSGSSAGRILSALTGMDLEADLLAALTELLTAEL